MPAYKDSKTGTWFVKFYCKDWTGENKQIKKRGFATKREALDYERNYKIRQENNLDMTFGEFWKLYTEDVKNYVKLNTWLTKEHIVDTKILPYFKNLKMNEITPGDVRKWQNEMVVFRNENGKSYSQTYKKTMHNILSAIFNHACRFYNLKSNPARQAGNMGREEKKEMLFWTTEEYKKFSEAVIDKSVSFYAFEMLYWTGMRLGELLALTMEDFDFEKNTVRINKSYQRLQGQDVITTPKTPKSNRTIKLPKFLAEEMQEYFAMLYDQTPTDRIFLVTKSFLHHEMERGCKLSGVKKIRIHDLRHPYVKHTTKIFSLRLMDFQAQAYPDARRKTRGACQLLRVGQSRSPVRPLCNRKRFSCLPPQSKMSWILYAISMRLSGYTSTRSISSSASSVVSVSASKIALDASFRLSCRACSSCFCFACANTAA